MLRTALYPFHVKHNARFVDFAGWEMPILYRSIHEEHHQVRNGAGMFDVSHMGRIRIAGRHARKLIETILTRRVTDMAEKTCRYSLICNTAGGVLDDVLIYRHEDYWTLVVNASNRTKILDHIKANVGEYVVKVEDQTLDTAMVAIQGPKVMEIVGQFSREVPTLKRYAFCEKKFPLKLTISRTGYTGEDGIEIILPGKMADLALRMLVPKSESADPSDQIQPCGLGARDTLRMEAGMPLYGHELNESIDPLTAGLGFAVSLDKDQHENGLPFIGQEALKRIAAEGPRTKLAGLKLEGKRTARQGMDVLISGNVVGQVTSGCLSPTLGYPIAMAYVPAELAEPGTAATVNLGNTAVDAQIVPLPFYKKPKTN